MPNKVQRKTALRGFIFPHEVVKEIKRLHLEEGVPAKVLAERYGVKYETIRRYSKVEFD